MKVSMPVRWSVAALAFAGAATLALPAAQAATTLTQAQISAVVNLLTVFGADPSVVSGVEATLEGSGSAPLTSGTVSGTVTNGGMPISSGPVTSGTTPVFCTSANLAPGAQGSAVLGLQQSLVAQGLLSNDATTGYYGFMTQVAVQKFQAQQGIVSNGSAATTGFGAVGPRTKAILCAKVMPSNPTTSNPIPPPHPLPAVPAPGSVSGSSGGVSSSAADQSIDSSIANIDAQIQALQGDQASMDSSVTNDSDSN